MSTILVANIKGGCGKTTIATHLAAAFANAGLRTALADVDRQRSSLGWLDRRPPGSAAIMALDWVKDLGKPPKKLDRLVIDAPAAMKMKQAESLIKAADVIVVPILPSSFDEAASARFLTRIAKLKPIAKHRTDVLIVGNRVRPNTRAAAALDGFLDNLGHRAVARLRDSAVYTDMAASGLALTDRPIRRTESLRDDWRPLIQAIEAAI